MAHAGADALVGIGKRMLGLGTAHLAALAPYGITQPTLDALDAALTAFANAIMQPQAAIQRRREATQRLANEIETMRLLLKQNLDLYAAGLQYTQENFYKRYQSARKLEAPPRRTIALRVRVGNGSAPVAGAEVRLRGQKVFRKTGPSGECRLKHLKEATYQMTVSAAGYVSQTVPVHIVKGEREDVVMVLEREGV